MAEQTSEEWLIRVNQNASDSVGFLLSLEQNINSQSPLQQIDPLM